MVKSSFEHYLSTVHRPVSYTSVFGKTRCCDAQAKKAVTDNQRMCTSVPVPGRHGTED